MIFRPYLFVGVFVPHYCCLIDGLHSLPLASAGGDDGSKTSVALEDRTTFVFSFVTGILSSVLGATSIIIKLAYCL
jgi:hypothetical protein